jgi:hypothetical protein
MSNEFHAVEWMRKVREEMDRENAGKPLRAVLEETHEKIIRDPVWKAFLDKTPKATPVRRLVKGA